MALKYNVQTIPHAAMRYETCGDWITSRAGSIGAVFISDLGNEDYEFLVGIHEQIEAYLCGKRGISEGKVTAFDVAYENERQEGDDSEPGDDPKAPYFKEHQFATKIERLIAEELGVDWTAYEKAICNL